MPRACASYPSCFAVYPRDSRSRRVLCRSSHSLHSIFSRFRLLAERAFAACAERAYTGAMRTAWKKIRYRLEWLGLKSATKFLPLLSRKACYRLALLLGSLGAMLADSKWKVKRLDLTPILNSLLLFGIHRELYRCQGLAVLTVITLELGLVP